MVYLSHKIFFLYRSASFCLLDTFTLKKAHHFCLLLWCCFSLPHSFPPQKWSFIICLLHFILPHRLSFYVLLSNKQNNERSVWCSYFYFLWGCGSSRCPHPHSCSCGLYRLLGLSLPLGSRLSRSIDMLRPGDDLSTYKRLLCPKNLMWEHNYSRILHRPYFLLNLTIIHIHQHS